MIQFLEARQVRKTNLTHKREIQAAFQTHEINRKARGKLRATDLTGISRNTMAY